MHVGCCLLVHVGECWCMIFGELLLVHIYCDEHVGVCTLMHVCLCMHHHVCIFFRAY